MSQITHHLLKANRMSYSKRLLLILPFCLAFQGCAIIMSANLPVARSPEKLNNKIHQNVVDETYGAPIAAGMSKNGTEYIEQIQFIDGVPIKWKITRIITHSLLDAITYFIWEIPGTYIETSHSNYPEYTYFVIYDSDNYVVRTVPYDSHEGQQLAKLPWASPKVNLKEDYDNGVNHIPTINRLYPGDDERLNINATEENSQN